MKPMYLGSFDSKKSISQIFREDLGPETKIQFAVYDQQDYDGSAFVLFIEGGKLYEVNASHCSCFGLEDQWSPDRTSIKALRHRMQFGNLGYGADGYKMELDRVLKSLERQGYGR